MKLKAAALLLSAILVSLIFIVLLNVTHKEDKPILNGKKLPEFYFETLTGVPFTHDSIVDKNEEFAICHFDPDCHFCADFATSLSKLQSNQLRIPLIMVSSSTKESVLAFRNRYKLPKFPSITILIDSKHEFYRYFGSGVIPLTYLYKNALLQNVYDAKSEPDFLKKP